MMPECGSSCCAVGKECLRESWQRQEYSVYEFFFVALVIVSYQVWEAVYSPLLQVWRGFAYGRLTAKKDQR